LFRVFNCWNIFLSTQVVLIGSGIHSASYAVGTGALFQEVKWSGREVKDVLLPGAEQSLRMHGAWPPVWFLNRTLPSLNCRIYA
jgi:hypothetical protein